MRLSWIWARSMCSSSRKCRGRVLDVKWMSHNIIWAGRVSQSPIDLSCFPLSCWGRFHNNCNIRRCSALLQQETTYRHRLVCPGICACTYDQCTSTSPLDQCLCVAGGHATISCYNHTGIGMRRCYASGSSGDSETHNSKF